MTPDELAADDSMLAYIKKIYQDPHFIHLKDAFVSHTPNADDKSECSVSVSYGKSRATAYVFNRLEELAKQTKKQPTPVRAKGKDPDLEE